MSTEAVFCATPALSDDVHLEAQQPSLDTTLPAKPILNGQVSREDSTGQPSQNLHIVRPGANVNVQSFQISTFSSDQAQDQSKDMSGALDKLFSKLSTMQGQRGAFSGAARQPMSADDFRQLQYGVIGMISQVSNAEPVVTQVYPSCPAALAGIRPGDVVIRGDDHRFRRGDGQKEMWQTVAGKAGTPVDITVSRDGELLTFHLIRMNIEDIESDRIRRMYEFILSSFGPPRGAESSHTRNPKNRNSVDRVMDSDADADTD